MLVGLLVWVEEEVEEVEEVEWGGGSGGRVVRDVSSSEDEASLLLFVVLDLASDEVDRRVFRSLFSFLASFRRFSKESMCILYSRFMVVSLVIFCKRSWFSVIKPLVRSSRSLMYSFLRWRDRAADCLFFNNLSCLFRVLSSSDLNSTLNLEDSLPRSEAAWISDAEAASSSS